MGSEGNVKYFYDTVNEFNNHSESNALFYLVILCSKSLSISRGDAFPNSANSIFLAQVRATQVLSQILNSILTMQKIAFVKNYFSNLLK